MNWFAFVRDEMETMMETDDWIRIIQLFPNSHPPQDVSERQFDGLQKELSNLMVMDRSRMTPNDLWYYYHDLQGNVELQREVFSYMLPACLLHWHRTLQTNQPCSHSDADLNLGLLHSQALTKLASQQEVEAFKTIIFESFIVRLKKEKTGLHILNRAPSFCWIERLNSVGYFVDINSVWQHLWCPFDSLGEQSYALLEYCTGLVYEFGEGPLADRVDGFTPCLWENDASIRGSNWLPSNVSLMTHTLTFENICTALVRCRNVPEMAPFAAAVRQIEADTKNREELIEFRIKNVVGRLAGVEIL
jgi:hypothetical protein